MQVTTAIGYTKTDKAGITAVVSGSALWGLFWIPLHYLESQGLSALWILVMVMLAALIPALLMTLKARQLSHLALADTWTTGFALGLATTLYFVALAYTDVIRVIFLFYLLPLWTTLSARIIYGEPIRPVKLLVMLIALGGLWLLLGGGEGYPMPESAGDWCAIASGMCWGISLSLLHGHNGDGACSRSLTTIISCVALSLLAALFVAGDSAAVLPTATERQTSPSFFARHHLDIFIATAFGLFAVYPALLAQIWGARRVPAPTAALLTMSEIVVAILSAALLIGTDLSPVALLGGAIILLALCLDVALQFVGGHGNTKSEGMEILNQSNR